MKWYNYIYARLYTWNLKKWGKADNPERNAALCITFLQFLNLLIIFAFLELLDVPVITKYFLQNKLLTVVLLVFLYLINRNIYLVNERYKRITKKMLDESQEQRRKHTVLMWLFVVLSFVLFSFLAYLSGPIM